MKLFPGQCTNCHVAGGRTPAARDSVMVCGSVVFAESRPGVPHALSSAVASDLLGNCVFGSFLRWEDGGGSLHAVLFFPRIFSTVGVQEGENGSVSSEGCDGSLFGSNGSYDSSAETVVPGLIPGGRFNDSNPVKLKDI